jgi:hypothetical protein
VVGTPADVRRTMYDANSHTLSGEKELDGIDTEDCTLRSLAGTVERRTADKESDRND